MTATPKGCIFVDACVAFAEILDENPDVMNKLKSDIQSKNIQCYISSSAIGECMRKLNYTERFFNNVFRTFAEGYFNDCRLQEGRSPNEPISKSDFKIFEKLFNQLRLTTHPLLQKPLKELEKNMVFVVEDLLRKKEKIDFGSFLRKFEGQALLLSAHLRIQSIRLFEKEQGFFKKSDILPDARISDSLMNNVQISRNYPFHEDDADNISSAWAYMNKNGFNTVFVTFDFRTIISHAEDIYRLIKLQCTDPLYAIYYF